MRSLTRSPSARRVFAFLLACALAGSALAVIVPALRDGGEDGGDSSPSPSGPPTDAAALWVFGFSTLRFDPDDLERNARIDVVGFGEVLGGDGVVHLFEPGSGPVGVLDATSNELEVLGQVPSEASPAGVGPLLAEAGDALWLVTGPGEVTRFRPGEGEADAPVPVAPDGAARATRVAGGADAVFAVSAFGDGDLTIARLDPATGAVSATAALPGDLDADGLGPRARAVGGDSVWVVGATAVARVDPASLEVTGRFEVDAGPGGIRLATFAGGALFALVENGAALLRIDGEGTVTDRLVLSEEPVEWRLPASLAAGRGHVWVMVQAGSDPARHDVRIVRVDPATGAATGVFTVASELFAGAIAVS